MVRAAALALAEARELGADLAWEVWAVALARAAPAVEAEAVQAALVSAAELAVAGAQKLLLESGSPHRRSSEGPL
jgi:hypothetical protein